VLAALIPMQQAGVEKSPFVLVFEKVGIPMRRTFLTL
jgi:S-methylmethionine transporter